MKFLSAQSMRTAMFACALLGTCIASQSQAQTHAQAALPPGMTQDQYKEYQQMLQVAERKVDRLNALKQGNPGALSTTLVMSVLGRYYQVGDNWDVLAWKLRSNMAAMTSEPVQYHYRDGQRFHYQVIDVKPGNPSQVTVRITQVGGTPVADPRVQWLDLTMTSQFSQDKKVYHFVGQNDFSASPNGVHTSVSSLELFPLDVPDIYTADRSTPSTLPELPPDIRAEAQKAGYSADLSQSYWFDQEDLFGRSIKILWQHGDLWPTYLETPTGIAILARR